MKKEQIKEALEELKVNLLRTTTKDYMDWTKMVQFAIGEINYIIKKI